MRTQHNPATPDAFGLPIHHPIFGSAPSPSGGRLAGREKWARVACRRRRVLGLRARGSAWRRGPTWKGHALLPRARRSEFRFPLTEAPRRPAMEWVDAMGGQAN